MCLINIMSPLSNQQICRLSLAASTIFLSKNFGTQGFEPEAAGSVSSNATSVVLCSPPSGFGEFDINNCLGDASDEGNGYQQSKDRANMAKD